MTYPEPAGPEAMGDIYSAAAVIKQNKMALPDPFDPEEKSSGVSVSGSREIYRLKVQVAPAQ